MASFLVDSILRQSLAPWLMIPLVAAATGLACWRPRWGLYEALAAMPLLSWVPSAFHCTYFAPAEILADALLAGWLIHESAQPRFRWRRSSLGAWWMALLVLVSSSAAVELKPLLAPKSAVVQFLVHFPSDLTPILSTAYNNPSALYPLRAALNYFLGLIIFLLVMQLIERPEQRTKAIHFFLFASVVVALCGILQYSFQFHLLEDRFVQSTLADKNSMGSYLVLALGIWVGEWMKGEGPARNYLSLVPIPLVSCTLIGSSRAAWGSAFLVLAAYAYLWLRPRLTGMRPKMILIPGLVLLLLAAGLVVRAWQRDVTVALPEDVSANFWSTINPRNTVYIFSRGRDRIWAGAMDAVVDAPWMGIGIGRLYTSPYIKRRFGYLENAHNYFLQVTAELGVIGLLVWLGLLFSWFREGWRQSKAVDRLEDRWTLYGLLLGVAAYVLTWVTSHPLLLPEQHLLFWSVMALVCGAEPAPTFSRRVKWLLVGFAVLMVGSVFFRTPMPPLRTP